MRVVKIFLLQLILLSLFTIKLDAQDNNTNSILKELQLLYEDVKIKDLANKSFNRFNDKYLTLDSKNKAVWVKLILYNRLSKVLNLEASISSPLINNIDVYIQNKDRVDLFKNLGYKDRKKDTVLPHFTINLGSNETKIFYIKITSSQLSQNFRIDVQEKDKFLYSDKIYKFINISIFGFIVSLIVLLFSLFLYLKEKSLAFLGIYLMLSLYIFFFDSGLMALYFPSVIIDLNFNIYVILLNLLFIIFSIYSLLFLKIYNNLQIFNIYKFLIALFILELIVASFATLPSYIVIATTLIFLSFNLFIGLKVLFKGLVEVRLYILGVLTLGVYILIKFFIAQEFGMVLYFISTILLLFAYLDRLIIYKNRELNILMNGLDKKFILDKKIEDEKKQLLQLETSSISLKDEINSTIKKSFESAISILKIQSNKSQDKSILESINRVERRLVSLLRVYNNGLNYPDLTKIDMKDFVEKLIIDTMGDYKDVDKDINITTDINATLKLQDALYIALSVVDAISTSYNNSNKESLKIVISEVKNSYNFSIKFQNKSFKKESFFKKLFLNREIKIFRA